MLNQIKKYFNSLTFIVHYLIILLISFYATNLFFQMIEKGYIKDLEPWDIMQSNIPQIIILIVALLTINIIYNMYNLIKLHMTDKFLKYISIFIILVSFLINSFSNYYVYTQKNIQNIYLNQQNNSSEIYTLDNTIFKNKKLFNTNQFKKFQIQFNKIIFQYKNLILCILVILILIIFRLIIESDIKKIRNKKYYYRWYLSEELGWIEGSKKTKDIKQKVLQPNDCIKIIELSLNYDKKYNPRISDFNNFLLRIDNYSNKINLQYIDKYYIIYKHYKTNKIQKSERKYGELPTFIEYANTFKLLKSVD